MAYVPYSQFPVGAAIECSDGTVFTGCNVENAALGSTICAERTAARKAVSEDTQDFVRIAIWGEGKDYCIPGGLPPVPGRVLADDGGPVRQRRQVCELQAQPAPAAHLQLLRWSWNSSEYSARRRKGAAFPALPPRL